MTFDRVSVTAPPAFRSWEPLVFRVDRGPLFVACEVTPEVLAHADRDGVLRHIEKRFDGELQRRGA